MYDYARVDGDAQLQDILRLINERGYTLMCVSQHEHTYTVFFRGAAQDAAEVVHGRWIAVPSSDMMTGKHTNVVSATKCGTAHLCLITAKTAAQRWTEGMRMVNTQFFVQCKDCEECRKSSFGYFCDKHTEYIGNPNVDGCTFGKGKEDGERREGK